MTLGIEISMDDFGMGYSSLNCLRRLPIQKLKIDQSFVRDLTSNRNDTVVVKAIISMAHNLGLKVIAEGIETIDQLKTLRSFRCDEGQGYLFNKPMTTNEATQFLLGKNNRYNFFNLDTVENPGNI
ncbi:MAG: EAL domain-containing protein [Nitrospiria bacterium]